MTREETLEHLRGRGVMPFLYPSLGVDEGVVSFPLYEFGGRWVGYQNYRPNADRNHKNVKLARYFTYLPHGTNGYFGLESLYHTAGPVYLVEGVFKATKLHRLGLPAVAMMGSETKRHRSQLALLGRRYVGIGDADAAGEKFAKSLGGFTSPQDLDEMSDQEVLELLNANYKSRK